MTRAEAVSEVMDDLSQRSSKEVVGIARLYEWLLAGSDPPPPLDLYLVLIRNEMLRREFVL